MNKSTRAKSYADTVAETLIEQLGQGTAPWVKPWEPGERFMPFNPATGKAYRGMNAVWLLAMAQAHGFDDARWMTYRQAAQAGGQVLKGEKGTVIQYWKWTEDVPLKDEHGRPVLDDQGSQRISRVKLDRPQVFSAVVFNAGQVAGLPPVEPRPAFPEWERHELAEAITANSGISIVYQNGDRACYSVLADRITMPERGQFPTADRFYATQLHELSHGSGHPSRLGRDLMHPFGSEMYAKEELRAEIASMMLGEILGIGHDPAQHVAYVGSWIKALKNDPREIFRAAADAEKIVTYLRGLEPRLAPTPEAQAQAAQASTVRSSAVIAPATDRVYLAVPFAEKNDAKKLGARWDKTAKSWFVPGGVDIEPFQRWSLEQAQTVTETNPIEKFADALSEMGLVIKGTPVMDGQLHRVPVEGDKRGAKSGAYVGHLDGQPTGFIENFKTGERRNWKVASTPALTEAERTQLAAENAARRAEREEARQFVHDETVSLLKTHLDGLPSARKGVHPYLTLKDVYGLGVLLNTKGPLAILGGQEEAGRWSAEGDLIVPIQNVNGQLVGAQSIDAKGRKSFPRGASWKGGFHVVGQTGDISAYDSERPVVITEGFSTGATIYEKSNLPVVVAFTAGNLTAVAEAIRAAHPERHIIIAGDNDHSRERETLPDGRAKPNTGRAAAEKAAVAVGGFALLPQFTPEDKGSDWNDLAVNHGEAVFHQQWQAGLAVAERHFEAGRIAEAREGQQKTQTLKQEQAQGQEQPARATARR